MSSTTEDGNPIHIECVDVDSSVKENCLIIGEITCDSGIDSVDSCSAAFPTSSDSEVLCLKPLENDIQDDLKNIKDYSLTNESNSSLSSSTSISPDVVDSVENLLNLDEFRLNETDIKPCNIDHDCSTKTDSIIDELRLQNIVADNVQSTSTSVNNSTNDLQSNNQMDVQNVPDFNISNVNSEHATNRQLATSTVSLNERHMSLENTNTISKTSFSRSAENISTLDLKPENSSLNSSTKDLNAEIILTQFTNQKSKASARQKIIADVEQAQLTTSTALENPQTNLDLRYSRLPKELLSQDLGSIVKNVHGIFSSVSGSLKNAYNHRGTAQKPLTKIVKPIPNSKVMDDIFEDESVERTLEVNGTDTLHGNNKPLIPEETRVTDIDGTEQENIPKRDMLRSQEDTLERVLSELKKENAVLRERVKQQVDELMEKDQTSKEFEIKLDLMGKRVEQGEREKDAAVMRYASVECAAIEARRAAERASAAERAAQAEAELLSAKLRSAHAEKQRICQLYDDKCHELQTGEREVGKLREDVRELEGRLKWTQSKLRMEMDAYKESAERAERLAQQVSGLEAARDAAAAHATDCARAKQLEAELKESQAALILCRHERDELERRAATGTQQLDVCTRDRDTATTALARITEEVEQLKVSNVRLEEEAAELAALRAQAALADTLSAQLHRESERAAQAEEALSRERARAETCARREAGALEHAARLTAQHVAQRARATDHEAKAQALSLDNVSLRERITALECECARAQAALSEETERRNKENRVLARKVAELTEEAADAVKKLEWQTGENAVLKKKHASSIKELNRELHRALKRCEQLEAKLPPPDAASTRTGSVSSLSSGESAPHEDRLAIQNGHSDALPDIQVREPDRQTLIERIVSLQRAAARRAERCEFLEEHARQLTAELRAKSRLLRHMLCALPAGAVVSRDSDAHKKEIARLGGGAMAAVWGGDPHGMTLELSLEMNKRLQAVLEDALLKNITLKENMDTLGEEIARLKENKSAETK